MIDISELSYDELKSLELDIQKKMKELKEARYKELTESAIKAVDALVTEGFGLEDAIEVTCDYCDSSCIFNWLELLDNLRDTPHSMDNF